MGYVSRAIVIAAFCFSSSAFAANLLRNGSFEDTPCATPCNVGPYFLPSEWLQLVWLPMVYSNDGSYGLAPDANDNFRGGTAQDGLRWVGAYSGSPEILGQVLTAPLEPGRAYTLTAYLRQATVRIANNPGTYQVELWSSTNSGLADKVVVGSFDLTSTQNAWEKRMLAFTAPPQASSYPVIAFRAMGSKRGPAYPGLDNVMLLDARTDSDGDGVSDGIDECPNSDMGNRVVILGCETGVTNRALGNGCTLSDRLAACATDKSGLAGCVASIGTTLQKLDLITGQEKGQLVSCAAQAR